MTGLAILGATGTIGDNTLQIVDQFADQYKVVSLTAGRNIEKFKILLKKYRPAFASVLEESSCLELQKEFPETSFGFGESGAVEAVGWQGVQTVVVGIVGFAAMPPTLRAIELGKKIALANKETLVVGGPLFQERIRKSESLVIPVDSEHCALFQLLEGRSPEQVQSLVLTASGGPLLRRPEMPLEDVTPQIAIAHPNWKMGPKISVDSATMMNKGLELIEAQVLFELEESQLEVWVHPQSIVHGAMWLKDNSCLAQLSLPDMRSSIGYALSYPSRLENVIPKLSMTQMANLEFLEPDLVRFPALRLAREVLKSGPSHRVVLNAANEVCVDAFLEGKILFPHIAGKVEDALAAHQSQSLRSLEDIFELDRVVRRKTLEGLPN